jgi:uncharacterized RDD family membrane protein YckC
VVPTAVLVFPPVYQVGFWTVLGQTPGMALLGLRVLRTDGRAIGLATAVRRWLCRLLSIGSLGFGFLMVLGSNRRQTLHDRLAGTVVVHDWPAPGQEPWRARATGLETIEDDGAGAPLPRVNVR